MDSACVGEADTEGDGEPEGDIEGLGDSALGAGPMGWAPLSAHAAVSAASTAVIAIKRFMGCLLLSGTQPMLEGTRNTGTPLVSRFGNRVGRQAQRGAWCGAGGARGLARTAA